MAEGSSHLAGWVVARGEVRRGVFFALLLLAIAAACSHNAPNPERAPRPEVSLLASRPLVIPHGCRVGGLRVGGLSGLARTPDGSYLAVVDNEAATPARVFRLAFDVGSEGVVPRPGRPGCGLAVAAIPLEGLDGKSFDGEGIAYLPSASSLLVSSETEPSIREVSLDGRPVASLPVPPAFLAAKGRGVRGNQGFESLALEPGGGALWTANERALQQDAPDDEARPSPVRLLRFERRGEGFAPTAQYVYEVDAIDRLPEKGFAVRGLAELLALPEGGLLALEREFVEGRGMRIQLYRVELGGATDVSGLESLAGQAWTPVKKTLVYDFARASFMADNLEGMALGPSFPDGSRTLVVMSDNNFSPLEQTQLVALRLPASFRGVDSSKETR
jgi:hypothetical protein